MSHAALATYRLVKSLALPPASLWIAFVAGLLLLRRAKRTAVAVLWATAIVFYVLAAPFTANRIVHAVATVPPLSDGPPPQAQAIVVLSASASTAGPEYGGMKIDCATLERIRYAAHLYRRKPLPILVSGGLEPGVPFPIAVAMKQALEDDFAVPVAFVEGRSRDTIENANFSAAILKSAGLTTIVLVTSATHMPRALALFKATGLTVIPGPTGFEEAGNVLPRDLIPQMAAMDGSEAAIYEVLGRLWHAAF